MNKETLLMYLKENFGIETEAQLLEAMRKAEPIDIGIMTSKKEEKSDD